MGEGAIEGLASHVVPAFADSECGLALPGTDGGVVLGFFLFEQMLIGDGDGDLSLDLKKLIFHVEDQLPEHFFGVFGLVDEVVEVGAEEGGDSFHECHDGLCSFWLRLKG